MNIAIIGASGTIGQALSKIYCTHYPEAKIFKFSRTALEPCRRINIIDESSIIEALEHLEPGTLFERVIVATGLLHDQSIHPEKALRNLEPSSFEKIILTNTLGPTLIAKHFAPLLKKTQKSVFAALSARVGSISDNHLGGWYSYRASKAALNMIIKNCSIEYKRLNPQALFLALHPGTVRGELSDPFLKNIDPAKVFDPEFSAQKLFDIIENANQTHQGCLIDWKGEILEY